MAIAIHTIVFIWLWMSSFWLMSIPLRNVAIIDYGWGLGFIGVSITAYTTGTNYHLPLVIAITLWGMRLFIYLLMRQTHRHEDKRYSAIREHYGNESFWWQSYGIIFMPQGLFMAIMSIPLVLVQTQQIVTLTPIRISLAVCACFIWLIGLYIESISDWQLLQFKRLHPNKLCNTGWWYYSRHPNYFGEILIWWSQYIFFVSISPLTWPTLLASISPIFIHIAIIKLSGVNRMESAMQHRYDNFQNYHENTSMLIPWWPKKNNYH